MKRIFEYIVVAVALMACNKVIETPIPENSQSQTVAFHFSFTQADENTKAKTDWADGDKIIVFFEGIEGKWCTMSYDGSSWTQTTSDDFEVSDFSGIADKKLNAVHFPAFVGNVTVAWDGTNNKFTFKNASDKDIYTYYMSAVDVAYSLSGTDVTATITMTKPNGFVQFFVPLTSDEIALGHTYQLLESHAQPKALVSVALDGTFAVDESRAAGYALDGYSASNAGNNGVMFAGFLTSAGVEATTYNFSMVTNISADKPCALGTRTLSGKSLTLNSGVILNLPAVPATSDANWSTISPFVSMGYAGGPLWATGNLGRVDNTEAISTTNHKIVAPLEAGDYFKWGAPEVYTAEGSYYTQTTYDESGELPMANDIAHQVNSVWRIPTRNQFDALMTNTNASTEYSAACWQTGWTNIGDTKGGALLKSTSNGISLFFAAAGYYSNGSLGDAGDRGGYWSSTPYDSDDASYYLNFRSSYFSTLSFSRYDGFLVRPVQN